ncbi:MAG: alpha/beta hydrolase [Chloroflexi bacterium]|nr:alpha/beta hydrolase [Chloroflexota bacterium]
MTTTRESEAAPAADRSLERAKSAWKPRLLANGVEPYDYERTTARVKHWEDWPSAWDEVAREHARSAEQAAGDGRPATAANYARLAALAHHFAYFALPRPRAAWIAAQRAKAILYRKAAPYLDPPAEHVEIPLEGVRLPGYLRKPRDVARPAVVLFLSGLDSTKEEHATFEAVLLRRGLATLTFDGPGQGEVWEHMPGRVDWEKAATAAVDFVHTRADLDATRIGTLGVSLGGYLAARSASLEPRLRAVAVCGGRFDQAARELDDPLHVPRLLHFWNVEGIEDLVPKLQASTLDGVIQRLNSPLLVVHGDLDTLSPTAGARRIYDAAPVQDKQWVLYPEGNHVCNNIPHHYRPLVADWLAERLGAS